MNLSRPQLRQYIQNFDLVDLFVQLGWDRLYEEFTVSASNQDWHLSAVAEKAGFATYTLRIAQDRPFPDSGTRRAIEKQVARRRREHIICYYDESTGAQTWQWVRREAGKPATYRDLTYLPGDSGDLLLEKLERLYVSIEEEERGLTVLDMANRADVAARADKVTKKFYDTFKKQHDAFKEFIQGIGHAGDLDWYTSLMLNRLMFIYFLQRRGFLDNDPDYLRNRLYRVQEQRGKNKFHSFYHSFLLVLFHQGLGSEERTEELVALIGNIPYLNGGLFDLHKLESDYPKIEIADAAFENLFDFFDKWDWHLDERPLRNQNEINPDVLGYIFEKYINQKQMGAYYTREDITEYITRSTVLPRLVNMMREHCKVAFEGDTAVWRYLAEDPDRYLFPAVRHGLSINWRTGETLDAPVPLPEDIAAGLDHIPSRTGWNRRAPEEAGLPTEIWREVIARRRRHDEVREKLASGSVRSIEDFITLNLDIRQFLQDVIDRAEGPDLLDAAWRALTSISILDPTCGSGAFLFAALNVLEPLYEAVIARMDSMVSDWRRAHPGVPMPTGNSYVARFAQRLADLARHPSPRYFVLKTIVLQNLYGVDIMPEAVEICKLRLFLKLVAQLESADQIEPLPDLDFNVRAGNTLVGFATHAQAKDAITSDIAEAASWPGIEYAAEQASGTFKLFRDAQADPRARAEDITTWKRLLHEQLEELRTQLDTALARQYGIDDPAAKPKKFTSWRESHQPFHWFVEFYGILHEGGFDAIIGNPPYVARKKIPYEIQDAHDYVFPDLYAYTVVRSGDLGRKNAWLGLIVPLSITFGRDYVQLRDHLKLLGTSWYSSFDKRPASVFPGVQQRCTIWVGNKSYSNAASYTTQLNRWRTIQRDILCPTLEYVAPDHTPIDQKRIPKLSPSLAPLWKLLSSSSESSSQTAIQGKSEFQLGFSKSGYNYLSVYVTPPPALKIKDETPVVSTEIGWVTTANQDSLYIALAALSGELAFLTWLVYGDGFHVTSGNIRDALHIVERIGKVEAQFLSRLGRLLHHSRFEALGFDRNAGQFIGNFSYRRKLSHLTRRADMLILAGLAGRRDHVIAIFDYTERLFAVSESADEKYIPESIKTKFPPAPRDKKAEAALFAQVDARISDHLGISQEEIDCLCSIVRYEHEK